MVEESVFDRLRLIKKGFDFYIYAGGYNKIISDAEIDAFRDYHNNTIPEDSYGEHIAEEINSRFGDLTQNEVSLAHFYFREDFIKTIESADNELEKAQEFPPGSTSKNEVLRGHLRLAGRLVNRAYRDIAIDSGFDPLRKGFDSSMDYDTMRDRVDGIARRLHLTWEFPDRPGEVIRLDRLMRKAVEREDFEAAAEYRDEMYSMRA